jgi:hypothetical protein
MSGRSRTSWPTSAALVQLAPTHRTGPLAPTHRAGPNSKSSSCPAVQWPPWHRDAKLLYTDAMPNRAYCNGQTCTIVVVGRPSAGIFSPCCCHPSLQLLKLHFKHHLLSATRRPHQCSSTHNAAGCTRCAFEPAACACWPLYSSNSWAVDALQDNVGWDSKQHMFSVHQLPLCCLHSQHCCGTDPDYAMHSQC